MSIYAYDIVISWYNCLFTQVWGPYIIKPGESQVLDILRHSGLDPKLCDGSTLLEDTQKCGPHHNARAVKPCKNQKQRARGGQIFKVHYAHSNCLT